MTKTFSLAPFVTRRDFLGAAAVIGTLAAVNPERALAVTSAEKQAEADAARTQLVSLQADLEAAANTYYQAEEKRQDAQDAMDAAQVQIDEKNDEIDHVQGRLSSRAREMYRNGASSYLDFLLGSTSFEEFVTNWDLLTRLNKNDEELTEQARQLREELQAAHDEYAAQEAEYANQAEIAAQAQAEADARVQEATVLVNSLDEEARQLLEEEQAAAAALAAAQAAAEAAAAEEAARQAAAAEAARNNSGSGASSSSNSGSSNSGSSSNGSSNSSNYDSDDDDYSYDSGSSSYNNGSSSSNSSNYSGGTSYNTGGSASDNSAVVAYAMSKIGCPYVWGAEGPDSFDCSGLVRWAYLQIGMSLPHYTESLKASATNIVAVSQARAGDVLYRYGHVGIAEVAGGVPYVHAPTFGAYVRDTDALSWAGFTAALQF